MGPDNAFGRNREATPQAVMALGEQMGFQVEVLPERVSATDSDVSSTSIRADLAAGDLEGVERKLGRRYGIRGPVVLGEQRGRQIGFSTANIAVTPDRALPAFGVYATWAYLGETRYASVTNVGRRPTFNGENISVETHIFDFADDIYDRVLRIEFIAHLRPEQKFDGIEALRSQIERDVARARVVLAGQA
jgi:riboflavin kinase/FMN adenylyltransferase